MALIEWTISKNFAIGSLHLCYLRALLTNSKFSKSYERLRTRGAAKIGVLLFTQISWSQLPVKYLFNHLNLICGMIDI